MSKDLWNFYVDKTDKYEFMRTLLKNGYAQSQSAAVRAFIKRYSIDKELQDLINPYIKDEVIIKKNGEVSIL